MGLPAEQDRQGKAQVGKEKEEDSACRQAQEESSTEERARQAKEVREVNSLFHEIFEKIIKEYKWNLGAPKYWIWIIFLICRLYEGDDDTRLSLWPPIKGLFSFRVNKFELFCINNIH